MTFTERELEVLRAICPGRAKSYLRIAQLLHPPVSSSTAEMHVRNIAAKLRADPEYRDGGPLLVVMAYAHSTQGERATEAPSRT